jgi:hypothetical protein
MDGIFIGNVIFGSVLAHDDEVRCHRGLPAAHGRHAYSSATADRSVKRLLRVRDPGLREDRIGVREHHLALLPLQLRHRSGDM